MTVTRVLAVGHSYTLGLNRAILRELAQDDSFEITVAAPATFHGDLRPITIEPEPACSRLRIVPLRAYLSRWIHVFAYHPGDLNRLVRRQAYDVVHAWEEPYILSGYQIARATDGTSARFCFCTYQNYVKNYPFLFRHFERAVLERSDAWITGGHLVYEAMRHKGFPAETAKFLPLSVDTSAFRPATETMRLEAQNHLGITGPVIGYLGRFTEEKGVLLLLRVIEALGIDKPWNLLMLGSGPLEPAIRRWAADRGITERVHIRLVKHEEVPQVLRAMDLLVAPSQTTPRWREQFGRMLIEAFAAGVPVVASDSGEIPWVASNAAVVVAESDVPGFTDAIRRLIDNPGERAELVRRGLLRAELYSSVRLARQYAEFYRTLAGHSL